MDIMHSGGGVVVIGLGGDIIRRRLPRTRVNIVKAHFFGGGRGDRIFLLSGHPCRVMF